MRIVLYRPVDTTTLRSHSVSEFVLMLKLGRHSLPW